MRQYANIIDMRRVCLRRNGKDILKDIDWLAPAGGNWAVIGANGSGKTTLLQIAGGILFPTSGEAEVLGCRFGATDLFQLRRRIGWVSSALNARMPRMESAAEIVVSGLKATFGLVYEYSPRDAEHALDTLRMMEMQDHADKPFGVLSQGEQQKVLFARSLMADPELLILDEACAGLDLQARESFLGVVGTVLREHRASVIMVTHHIEEIPPDIRDALILKNGGVLACGPVGDALTPEVLSEAFGVGISVDRSDGRFFARVG